MGDTAGYQWVCGKDAGSDSPLLKTCLARCPYPFLGRRVGGMGLNLPGLCWDIGKSMGQVVEGKNCQGRACAAFQALLP